MYKIFAYADEASPMIDGQISAMQRNHLNGLEIRNVDDINISDISLDKAKEVKRKLDDAGLEVWAIGSPIGKINIAADDFSKHIEKFKHTLEIADILSAKNMRIFSFYMPENADYSVYKEEVIERLGILTDIAGNSIALCHENEKGIYGDTAERCLELFRAIPELKGVFDPANFVQCSQNTLEAWELLKEHIKYLHIKDSRLDGTIVPAGQGDGNIKEIASRYIKRGGCYFTMEPHLMEFSGLNNLEKEGATSIIGGNKLYKNNDEAFDVACQTFKSLI